MRVSGDDAAMGGYSVPDSEKWRLVAAWRRAEYAVLLDGETWPLHVGETAAALERRLHAASYLLISAWNPPPGITSGQRNRAADASLRQRLRDAGVATFPTRSGDGQGGWIEPGWLALDLPCARADALAREFGQGGVLYWHRGEAVGLRLMWTAPDGAGPAQNGIVWAG